MTITTLLTALHVFQDIKQHGVLGRIAIDSRCPTAYEAPSLPWYYFTELLLCCFTCTTELELSLHVVDVVLSHPVRDHYQS